MSLEPNDAAFPRPYSETLERSRYFDGQKGLTKREEFAKAAMVGMHAGGRIYSDQIPELAVKEADALIEALNKIPEIPLDKIAPPPVRSPAMGDDIPF